MKQTQVEQLFIQIRSLQEQLAETNTAQTALQNQVTLLNNQVQTTNVPGITLGNDIRNSDFNYSKLAYTGSGANTDAAHFYKHYQIKVDTGSVVATTALAITEAYFTTALFALGTIRAVVYGAKADGSTLSVTLTRVSDTQATMSATSNVTASALEVWFGLELNEAHANGAGTVTALETTATAGAKWDKATSTALIGGNDYTLRYSIDQPLSGNPAAPSLAQYFQILARLIDGAGGKAAGLSFYVGIWDETAGQQRWLEATPFTLTATAIGPHTGGATTRTFRIIATTDWGEQIQSEDAVVTGTVDPLTTSNYVSLDWDDLVGINQYKIYEFDGTNYFLIWEINNGSHTYFVDGTSQRRQDTAWPTITSSKWRALVVLPADRFSPVEGAWRICVASLLIPNTYNMQATTGKQWLRFGLTSDTPDLSVRLDHAGISTAPGTSWQKSTLDQFAVSLPDGNGDSGDQGPGTPGPIVPPGSGSTINCVSVNATVWTTKGRKLASLIRKGMICSDGLGGLGKVASAEIFDADSTIVVVAENGAEVRCSLQEPVITAYDDEHGTPAARLKIGDHVVTGKWGRDLKYQMALSRVLECRSGGAGKIVKITMEKGTAKRYLAGGKQRAVLVHNVKILNVENPN